MLHFQGEHYQLGLLMPLEEQLIIGLSSNEYVLLVYECLKTQQTPYWQQATVSPLAKPAIATKRLNFSPIKGYWNTRS